MGILWSLFGMSGWWSCNAILAQLPIFIITLPAAESLGNQLSMMTQVGNIFSISYKISSFYITWNVGKIIHGMMAVACVSLLVCGFLWDKLVAGHSIPLLALTALTGGMGCMSDVTYWAYVMNYPAQCTKALSVGTTLGGLLATLVAAVQMSGRPVDNPRFGTTTFLFLAAVLQVAWWVIVLQVEGSLRRMLRCLRGAAKGMKKRLLSGDRRVSALPEGQSVAELDEDHGEIREGLPSWTTVKGFEVSAFIMYASTYTLPTLLPFVAGAYPQESQKQKLLLWMMVCQNAGDVLGRIFAPRKGSSWCIPLRTRLPQLVGLAFPLSFAAFTFGALRPVLLTEHLAYHDAQWLLPMLAFAFYFSRGVIVTSLFLTAGRLTTTKAAAEHLASSMGFLGQMGALSANIIAFSIVNFLK